MKRFIGYLCFLCSLCCCSPLVAELSDDSKDDFTSRLSWEGDADRFTIDEKGVRLNDKAGVGGSAFLATPSTQIRGMRWEFRVHLFFNPSANNFAKFYLGSSSEELLGPLRGYFLQIGGSKDRVSLYRQEGMEAILLASGRELMKDNQSPECDIKVECDDNGYWTLWTCMKGETDYVKELQVRDATFTTSASAGICCFYTATRCKGFLFSHIRIASYMDITTKPEEPGKPAEPEEPDQKVEGLLLNEVMYHPASDGAEYVELYNGTTETISLLGVYLEKQKIDGTPINGGRFLLTNGTSNPSSVAPGAYICFTSSVKALKKKHRAEGNTLVELAGFPALSDKGGILVLGSEKEGEIDRCLFTDNIHTLPKKNIVGVSLEKRLPQLASDETSNWCSSQSSTGGTPGTRNSVATK